MKTANDLINRAEVIEKIRREPYKEIEGIKYVKRSAINTILTRLKTEIKFSKDVISFRIIGIKKAEGGMGLEYFEIPCVGLTGYAEGEEDDR